MTQLSAEDRNVRLSALEAPAAATEALREAIRMHDRRVIDDR